MMMRALEQEQELAIAIDARYPSAALAGAVRAFRVAFPTTPLRVYVEVMDAAIKPVLDGRCRFGVIGALPTTPERFCAEYLLSVRASAATAAQPSAQPAGGKRGMHSACHLQLVSSSEVSPMHAVYRDDAPPGPAGRWFMDALKQGVA